MARICSTVIVLVCLLTSSALAQEPKPARRTIVLDVSIIEMNRNQLEEMESLTKDKARLDRFIADGKAQPVAKFQMRARSGGNASARIGQRVPVQTQAQAAGQIQYENTGINVDFQPTVIDGDKVEVGVHIELSGVAKSSNPLAPTFMQRSFNDTVQVRAGEVALLLGVAQYEFLWSQPAQTDAQAVGQARGSFVMLLSVRLLD